MKRVPNCRRCRDREICKAPCDALKRSLNKKFPKNGKELNIGVPTYSKNPWPDPLPRKKYSHKEVIDRDKIILTLDGLGFPRNSIAQAIGSSKKNMRYRIYAARKRFGLV